MSILDNLRLMVRHYPGGISSLSPRLNKAVSTLEKELRGAEGFKLGALDAEEISLMCIEAESNHCHAYVNAVAGNCGRFISLEIREQTVCNLQTLFADVVKDASDVLSSGVIALSDNVISDNELKNIERGITESVESLQELMRSVKAANISTKRDRV